MSACAASSTEEGFGCEFYIKNSVGRAAVFLAVLLAFLRGVLEIRVFFDGNLLVNLW
jgi:hypothetical protein